MITLLNYANQAFRTSQRKNTQTGLSVGAFDQVLSYGPEDIDPKFREAEQQVLQAPRGNGYWLWKPYFIQQVLTKMSPGEWLFYCDSGSYFIHSIRPLLGVAESSRLDLLTFADAHPEKHYVKRDALLLLDADNAAIMDSPQRLGGFSLWRNTAFTRQFAATWLQYCLDPRILTDQPNELGRPNYPEFKDHRHDQAIFSILAKKHGLPAFRDPSQWGNTKTKEFPNSPYPQLIELTRKRDVPLRTRLKRGVKKILGRK